MLNMITFKLLSILSRCDVVVDSFMSVALILDLVFLCFAVCCFVSALVLWSSR